MEWLKIIAIVATMSDGIYSCNAINSGRGYESNKLMPSTCKGIILQKSITATSMFVFKWKNIDKGIAIGTIAGSSIGLTVSIYSLNKKD